MLGASRCGALDAGSGPRGKDSVVARPLIGTHARRLAVLVGALGAAAALTAASAPLLSADPPPPRPLVAAYGFESAASGAILDSSGAGNDGVTDGSAVQGRYGRALQLDGGGERAAARGSAPLGLRRAASFEAWVRPDAGGGPSAVVDVPGRGRLGLFVVARGQSPAPAAPSPALRGAPAVRVPVGRWTHVAVVYDGATARLYAGGVLVGRRRAAIPAGQSAVIRMGGDASTGTGLRGAIDDVRVYSVAISPQRIARDMMTGVAVRAGTPATGSAPVTKSRKATLAPAAAPAPPPARTAPSGAGGFQFGYVANADIDTALAGIQSGGGRIARVEFSIGAPTSELLPYVDAARQRGIEVLLLAGFDHRIPTQAEAQNLGSWARTFGPGGTYWAGRPDAALASRFIEFGNETSYEYQGVSNRGGDYALRFRDAYQAIQAANPAVGLLAQADDANSGSSAWVDAMYGAVPNLSGMVAGWTVHPYGPRSRWEPRIDRLIQFTAAHGAPSTIPIDITEWGIATDDGRNLSDNYDWPTNMTYAQAADAVTQTIAQMRAKPGAGARLRLFMYFQARDQQPSGSSGDREHYFGLLRSDGSAKGPLTDALRAEAALYPAH